MINWYRNKGKGTVEETTIFFPFFFPWEQKAIIFESIKLLCLHLPPGFVVSGVVFNVRHIGYSHGNDEKLFIKCNEM